MLKPPECSECILGRKFLNKEGELTTLGYSFTKTIGKPRFGVYVVGESAGKSEGQEGEPFVKNGESGSLINKIIENITIFDKEKNEHRKLNRFDFSWDNVIKCRPPNDELVGRNYEESAIECCSVYNSRSFGNPVWDNGGFFNKVILALGPVAFKYLTGISGKKKGIEDLRGYVHRSSNYNALVIGSLHPTFIRKGNARRTNALIYDVKKALKVADGSYTSYRDYPTFNHPTFVLKGKLEALVSFYYKCRDNSELTIYYDIENPYTKGEEEEDKGDLENEELEDSRKERSNEITSIQFGTDINWAITVPWEKPFIKVTLAILALQNDKVGANVWHHDNPRIEANGAIINGTNYDLMWAWHHLQPGLWKGLQRIGSFFDVPYHWKHLALETGNDDEYGGMDVIAPAYIWPKLVRKMKAVGVWESYLKFKVRYRANILRPTELRGMPVDAQEHEEFKGWVEGEVKVEDANLQSRTPQSLRSIKPNRKSKITNEITFGYVREPKIISGLSTAYETTRTRMLASGTRSEHILPFEQFAFRKSGFTFKQFGTDEGTGNPIFRWCKIEPFKASSQQLVKYLKYMMVQEPKKGYYVPQDLKSKRDTTGKKELQEVWEKTGDELLGSVIRIRSYSKMLSNDIPNWLPDKDGVVRTTFKFDPPNWQLNSSSPNIQNASKHPKEWELFGKVAGELQLIGQRFRKIVKAPPGRCVVEFDKSAFHAVIMGFEAKDPAYIRAAKLDLHTILTSYIVGQPIDLNWSETHIKDAIKIIKKEFKQVRDSQAKPTGLGNQLGLGSTKLFYMNKTYIDSQGVRQVGIPSISRAKHLQEILKGLFPKVDKAKERFKEEAHYKSYLLSEYGAIRWFYDVLRWDWTSRRMKNGSEAEEAIGHKVQAPAFGHIHSEIIDMGENSEILQEHWFANTVHDSVVLFPEIDKRERCIEEVLSFMTKPDKVLQDSICAPDGLVVDVDVMASCEGGNWASWHKERNPMGIMEIKL